MFECGTHRGRGATEAHAACQEGALRYRDISITFERKEVRNFFFPRGNSTRLVEPTEETLADFMATNAEDLRATKLRGDSENLNRPALLLRSCLRYNRMMATVLR